MTETIIREFLKEGILGILVLVEAFIIYRLYQKLQTLQDRLINKGDTKLQQASKILENATQLAKDVVSVSDSVNKTISILRRGKL